MFAAFARATGQLLDPRLIRIVVICIVLTLVVYATLVGGLIWLLTVIQLANVPWLDVVASLGTVLAAVLLAALLFPGTVSAVMSLWQDEIVDAVEDRHYPALGPARGLGTTAAVWAGARLFGLTLLVNLLMLPIYAIVFFIPPLNVIVFALVNGVLIGREFFEAVTLRRMTRDEARALRQRHRGTIFGAGVLTAFTLMIPGLNLIAPVLGTAAFVHLVHRLPYSKI
jgi:uncharacterized protein involved in cysteine biosynthesis